MGTVTRSSNTMTAGVNDPVGEEELAELMSRLNLDFAQEEQREKSVMYLNRRSLSEKMRSLLAMAISLANGNKDSSLIYFNKARKQGADALEILDAIKVTKMILMCSAVSSLETVLKSTKYGDRLNKHPYETKRILKKLKNELGEDSVSENLLSLGRFSLDLFCEHIKETSELLSPLSLDKKSMYMIACSVSLSVSLGTCARMYLEKAIDAGASKADLEDAMAVSRFVKGDLALTNGIEIMRRLGLS